jgi:hypothetical protein
VRNEIKGPSLHLTKVYPTSLDTTIGTLRLDARHAIGTLRLDAGHAIGTLRLDAALAIGTLRLGGRLQLAASDLRLRVRSCEL